MITLAIFGNNQYAQLLCGEAVSGDKARILREVIEAMVHVEKQQTARWQKINEIVIKTWWH